MGKEKERDAERRRNSPGGLTGYVSIGDFLNHYSKGDSKHNLMLYKHIAPHFGRCSSTFPSPTWRSARL